jgi:hypothetical protein
VIAAIGTFLTVPEFRCSVGLLADTCAAKQRDVELITLAETGEPLEGVKVQVISRGAPEIKETDNNGYAKVRIASRGDVHIILLKPGYPTQNFDINLENDQNTVRTIRLSKSGTPQVNSSATIPPTPPPPRSEVIDWNKSISELVGKVDQDFTYTCSPNGTIGRIWGTDFYSSSSSICSAAVHAGLINARDGGEVRIRIRSGEDFYNGTTRNDVTSERYGSYRGSFAFLNSNGSLIVEGQIKHLDWSENASPLRGKLDQDFTYLCPSNGAINARVYGTDLYTIDSPICSAAVHAGVINAKDGGKVQIRIRPGEAFYNGTQRNGVTSLRYSEYDWSYKFIR